MNLMLTMDKDDDDDDDENLRNLRVMESNPI
jgi:hypothetical protein